MKTTALAMLIAGILIGGALVFGGSKDASPQVVDNVKIVDGKQVITINAKGGYFPKVTAAKAGIPTVIKVDTQGTFDCSSALTIPSLGISKNLPPTGETEIEVPAQEANTAVRGLCAMGMYNFSVQFN